MASPIALPVSRLALAGVAATGPGLLVLVVSSLLISGAGFIEVVADGVTGYIPVDLFRAGLETFGPLAKGLLHLGVAAGVIVAGTLLAVPALRLTRGQGWRTAGARIALVAFLLAEAVVLPVFGAGFFAMDLATDAFAVHAPLALGSIVYGLLLTAIRDRLVAERTAATSTAVSGPVIVQGGETRAQAPAGMTRRSLLGRTLVVVGGASVLAAFGSLTAQALSNVKPVKAPAGGPTPGDPFGPTPALTPVDDFYQVSKNLTPTNVDGASWKLTVDGLVDRPFALTLDELRAIPSVTGYRTLECISTNIVRGDHLIGNQEWRGVPISTLLERAGVRPGAAWILWEAEDGFTESTPLEVALEPDSWIAYEMGGAPLTADHGFPARVLIAGRFGMKQPKWVRRMQLADHDEDGFWVVRGWDKEAIVKPMSRIDYPRQLSEVPVGQPFWVTGIAYAGDRGVMRVELSLDDGGTWVDAELDDAATSPLGPLTWVRWRTQARLDKAGSARLRVRATDGAGQVQDGVEREPIPSGASGWHRLTVRGIPPSG